MYTDLGNLSSVPTEIYGTLMMSRRASGHSRVNAAEKSHCTSRHVQAIKHGSALHNKTIVMNILLCPCYVMALWANTLASARGT